MVGMPHTGAESRYEAANFAAMGQALIGSKMGEAVIRRDIPWMVDLYEQGRLKLDELISGRWRLDQINEAIADTKTGAPGQAQRDRVRLRRRTGTDAIPTQYRHDTDRQNQPPEAP